MPSPAEQLCVCGHPKRLHWLRGGDPIKTGEAYPVKHRNWQHQPLTPTAMPIYGELTPTFRAECAMPCECGAYEAAKSSARKASQG